MKKVIVVATHPDDETLMCGGTLLKHKKAGDKIFWMIVTNIHENHGRSKKKVNLRKAEIEKVSQMYGFSETFNLDFPTTMLDIIPKNEIITSISKVFNKVEPNIVYLPNNSDVHSDHRVAFETVYACTKNFRYPFIERILMGESLSETEFAPSLQAAIFNPNLFVDITNYFDRKIEIMEIYESELMDKFLPRSTRVMKAQAIFRGSRIGVKYAEAFQILLNIR